MVLNSKTTALPARVVATHRARAPASSNRARVSSRVHPRSAPRVGTAGPALFRASARHDHRSIAHRAHARVRAHRARAVGVRVRPSRRRRARDDGVTGARGRRRRARGARARARERGERSSGDHGGRTRGKVRDPRCRPAVPTEGGRETRRARDSTTPGRARDASRRRERVKRWFLN